MPAEYIDPTQRQAIAQKQLADRAKTTPNRPDPFMIYKSGELPRRVHRVDFSAWYNQGWRESQEEADEIAKDSSVEDSSNPDETETVTDPNAYDKRKAELETLLRQSNGWRKIEAIAKGLGIAQKPAGGWDDAIPMILEKEGLSGDSSNA